VNELYVAAGKNALYVQQGRAAANAMADRVTALFKADADLMDYFNHALGNGKWNHFMDQVHIGYTIWQDPPKNTMPRITRVMVSGEGKMAVAVEGSASAWPGSPGDPSLPRFDVRGAERHYLDIFNRGASPFEFTAVSSVPWILISTPKGEVDSETRIWITIDWKKAPRDAGSGTIRISQAGGASINVNVQSLNLPPVQNAILGSFLEGDGFVSIEAEHFIRSIPAGRVRWEKVQDYGKTLSAMSVLPATASSVMPPEDSPHLEYGMYLQSAGDATVLVTVAPTLNFMPDRGLRIAVSFDDQPLQMAGILPPGFDAKNGNREWEESVKNSCRIVRSSHKLPSAGYHTLKIWMVDPAVVLQKVVVDRGGVRPSCLGPPESRRVKR
jgi:hypothetical protein